MISDQVESFRNQGLMSQQRQQQQQRWQHELRKSTRSAEERGASNARRGPAAGGPAAAAPLWKSRPGLATAAPIVSARVSGTGSDRATGSAAESALINVPTTSVSVPSPDEKFGIRFDGIAEESVAGIKDRPPDVPGDLASDTVDDASARVTAVMPRHSIGPTTAPLSEVPHVAYETPPVTEKSAGADAEAITSGSLPGAGAIPASDGGGGGPKHPTWRSAEPGFWTFGLFDW